MPARWTALIVCSLVVGAPPLEVSPPIADFDEWEVYQAHSVVQAAKDAKKDLDAMRKAHDVALSLPVHKSNCRGSSPPLLNAPDSLIDLPTGLTLMRCGSRSNTMGRT